jgi:photosystem II stability/assembly factor-like uncharacterized protein
VLSSAGLLSGTPDEVAEANTSEFTLRASEYDGSTLVGFRDRTFSMTVGGVTSPRFITPAGTLFTVLDSTWVDFQIEVSNVDPNITYSVNLVVGDLPSGLQIDHTGLIRGYANPPLDSSSAPVNQTYTFTLEVSSVSGISRSQFSITVDNQELVSGFTGRNPVIYNNNPPSFYIPDSDPYKSYYTAGSSIGNFSHDNNFIFKIIGHDFEEDQISYEITGLSSPPLGFTVDNLTGWIYGTIPDIGEDINTYYFTARVYKTLDPSKTSAVYYFSMTVVGNIDIRIEWVTSSDLGQIINGTVCDKTIQAVSRENLPLNYRIVGNNFASNIASIVSDGSTGFFAFGSDGSIITGSSDGLTWEKINTIPAARFTSAVYDSFTNQSVVVGYDSTNIPLIITTADGEIYTNVPYSGTKPLRSVSYLASLFIALGDDGTIITTTNPASWTSITSGVTANLKSVAYGSSTFVIVGDDSTILTSPDAATWTQVPVTFTGESFTGITWTGTKFLVVSASGTIGSSSDGITWDFDSLFDETYTSISTNGSNILILGENGVILRSLDDGLSWDREVSRTFNTLNSAYYDAVLTMKWYVSGTGGAILSCPSIVSGDVATWTSPTLGELPVNLMLHPNGDISGRLAFESTSSVAAQDSVKTYTFNVQAYSPEFEEVLSARQFTLTTYQQFINPFDTLYIKAMPSIEDRVLLADLLNNPDIIPDQYVYRINDQYFGKAKSVVYEHMFGVPSAVTEDYIAAVELNHYNKSVTLGNIKTAVARDSQNNIIYEVVYSEIIDDLVNPQGISISKEIIWPRFIQLYLNNYVATNTSVYTDFTYYDVTPQARRIETAITSSTTLHLDTVEGLFVAMNVTGTGIVYGSLGEPPTIQSIDLSTNTITLDIPQTFIVGDTVIFSDPVYTSLSPGLARVLYPNSLINMRKQIENSIGRINDVNILPSWMKSQQLDGNTSGYVPAWVICYTKPGYSTIVKNNIETLLNFRLNDITFGIDRFEIDRSMTYNYNPSTGIWNTLPSAQPQPIPLDEHDSYVYVPRKTILPRESQE